MPVKKYWQSLEERENLRIDTGENPGDSHENAVIDLLDNKTVDQPASRRDFLKLWGFSIGAAALAASCKRPVQKAIPFLIRPEEVTPGMAKYFASTYFDGEEYASILVKTRDGRPIKLEPNDRSEFGATGTTARVQASILGLYDDSRYKHATRDKEVIGWEEADRDIMGKLAEISARRGKIVILSGTLISPTTKAVMEGFRRKYPGTEIITYDASSQSGMLKANQETFGGRGIPLYRFDKADVIVSFGADFLGSWLSTAEYTAQYASRRDPKPDVRIRIKPSQERLILAGLYNILAARLGAPTYLAPKSPVPLEELMEELLASKGRSLLISGSNDEACQQIINQINLLLGNYGETIHLGRQLNIRGGLDEEMIRLIHEMQSGEVDALLCYNVNPAYDYPNAEAFIEGLANVGLTLSFASHPDETADLVQYVCPDSHYLESWNDAEAKTGYFSLGQPVIPTLFETRQVQDTLLKWSGETGDFHSFMKAYWQNILYEWQNEYGSFEDFWNHSLQDGVFEIPVLEISQPDPREVGLKKIMEATGRSGAADDIELLVYESVGLGTGKQANNPWLMELPDPVTKLCWDNVAAISPALGTKLGLATGDVVRIADKVELPVLLQPGQADDTVSVAAGYGRTVSGKVASGVGSNAYPLLRGKPRTFVKSVTIEKTGMIHELALTQEHHSMEGRAIVRETSLKEYGEDPHAGNELHQHVEEQHTTLYEETKFDGHHWGLAIDLNKCVGCSACAIACQTENNVAVVGKDEVRRRRIMHWIRIDRYYSESPDDPRVYHQPVMCQHCDNAPCENVCPVSATNHSNEGINQMSYNRCIGTKYCINNCPYRVRRFNWFAYVNNQEFDFHQNSRLGKMVLNPDVVVRERGVVEKCSFCVQRIQEKKLQAKGEERSLQDGEIKTACAQACPADALIFGDLKDPESRVSKLFEDERNYHLLEELHILPSVGYLTKVRNIKA
jgi:molybdopterin-containing oxidoreductase family iron-sulfur binding subunit